MGVPLYSEFLANFGCCQCCSSDGRAEVVRLYRTLPCLSSVVVVLNCRYRVSIAIISGAVKKISSLGPACVAQLGWSIIPYIRKLQA